jgi:hypothetical protein
VSFLCVYPKRALAVCHVGLGFFYDLDVVAQLWGQIIASNDIEYYLLLGFEAENKKILYPHSP